MLPVLQYLQALLFVVAGAVSVWLAAKTHTLLLGVVGLPLLAVGIYAAFVTYKKQKRNG